jgi:hypothetical protein
MLRETQTARSKNSILLGLLTATEMYIKNGNRKVDQLMQYWSEIQVLARRDGLSLGEIARRLGISRVTVRQALVTDGPPAYERAAGPPGFDPFEVRVVVLLRDHPSMPVR